MFVGIDLKVSTLLASLFCFYYFLPMFSASPVLLNLTVIKCRLCLIKRLPWASFAQPLVFVLRFVD